MDEEKTTNVENWTKRFLQVCPEDWGIHGTANKETPQSKSIQTLVSYTYPRKLDHRLRWI